MLEAFKKHIEQYQAIKQFSEYTFFGAFADATPNRLVFIIATSLSIAMWYILQSVVIVLLVSWLIPSVVAWAYILCATTTVYNVLRTGAIALHYKPEDSPI